MTGMEGYYNGPQRRPVEGKIAEGAAFEEADPDLITIVELASRLANGVDPNAQLELYRSAAESITVEEGGQAEPSLVDPEDGPITDETREADYEYYSHWYGQAFAAALYGEPFSAERGSMKAAAAEAAYRDMPPSRRLQSSAFEGFDQVFLYEPQTNPEDIVLVEESDSETGVSRLEVRRTVAFVAATVAAAAVLISPAIVNQLATIRAENGASQESDAGQEFGPQNYVWAGIIINNQSQLNEYLGKDGKLRQQAAWKSARNLVEQSTENYDDTGDFYGELDVSGYVFGNGSPDTANKELADLANIASKELGMPIDLSKGPVEVQRTVPNTAEASTPTAEINVDLYPSPQTKKTYHVTPVDHENLPPNPNSASNTNSNAGAGAW